MALILDSVSYEYAAGTPMARTALVGVDLTLAGGDLVCVLGPTGSGKTTLLRVAAGLLAPSAGTASADGGPTGIVGGKAGELTCMVGIAFQRPENQLFAETVFDDVEFGPRNLGASDEQARSAAMDALAAVALDADEFGDRSPFTLSGGEARRVALAGVLAMAPRYLLLDEPTAGLDARGRAAVAVAIERARERSGVLVVTHDAEEFLTGADRAIVLREGESVYEGDVPGLLERAADLERDGLWSPPEVVRTQLLAARSGYSTGPITLEPAELAAALARGRPR